MAQPSRRVHLQVPDLARVPAATVQGTTVDDDPGSDADLPREVDEVGVVGPGAAQVLGQRAEVGVVADRDVDVEPEPLGEDRADRDVDPPEVRGEPDDVVRAAHEAGHGDPEADEGRAWW